MADAAGDPPSRAACGLDASTRQRLLVVLQEELRRAGDNARARGMPPRALAAQLDERIARLRAQLNDQLPGTHSHDVSGLTPQPDAS